jgi:hypothetical protein
LEVLRFLAAGLPNKKNHGTAFYFHEHRKDTPAEYLWKAGRPQPHRGGCQGNGSGNFTPKNHPLKSSFWMITASFACLNMGFKWTDKIESNGQDRKAGF